jgi:hypothetical protein
MTASTLFVRATVLLAGLSMLTLGLWAFFFPTSFAQQIATFPPYNLHLLHDLGAFQIGIGTGVLLCLVWRDPVLVGLGGFVAASGMHTVSHMVDRGLGGRDWDAYALGAITVLAAVAMVVRRSGRHTGAAERVPD